MSGAAYEAASELLTVAREAHGRALTSASSLGLAEHDVDPFHALTNECLRWRNDGERLIRESCAQRDLGHRRDLAEQACGALALALQKARDAHKLALASADGLAPGPEAAEDEAESQSADADLAAPDNASDCARDDDARRRCGMTVIDLDAPGVMEQAISLDMGGGSSDPAAQEFVVPMGAATLLGDSGWQSARSPYRSVERYVRTLKYSARPADADIRIVLRELAAGDYCQQQGCRLERVHVSPEGDCTLTFSTQIDSSD